MTPNRAGFRISDLRALLDRDRNSNGVISDKSGKISRRHYALLLGVHRSALTRCRSIFEEYEKATGVATGPQRRLSEMRSWLSDAYETRALKIRAGKLDRSAFRQRFKLYYTPGPPAIRALLNEFDERAKREGYLPAATELELERVRTVLAGQPVLNRDRLTISRVELAKAANVPLSRFHDKVFADVVASRQAEIAVEVAASKIDPYVHGRVFPFSDLVPRWPTSFLEGVGARFRQIGSSMARLSVAGPYVELTRALRWIGDSADPNCRAVVGEAFEWGRVLSAGEWEDALFAYRDHLLASVKSGAATEGAIDGAIACLRIALAGLSSNQLVPVMPTLLPGVKHRRRRSGHLRSVAEASASTSDEVVSDYIAFAQDHFLQACKAAGTDLEKGEAGEFIRGLASELSSLRELPADPAKAILLLLEHRLEALHSRAASIVEAAIKAHERGWEMLTSAEIDGAQFERVFVGCAPNSSERTAILRAWFPKSESSEGRSRGICNLLALIVQRHGGVPPAFDNSRDPYNQLFAKRYYEYGGINFIESLLIPTADTVGAVLLLYLIESGANISVGRTLDRGCIEISDLAEHRRITGHKVRAKGKPIIVDLPANGPAVRAIEWLLNAGKRFSDRAGADMDRLFLMRIGSRVQLMTATWFTAWFKRFAASTPGLERIRLVPHMIRPSVLLSAALRNDGRLLTGVAIGQHGVGVSQGYQQKWPTRLLYDANIRRFLTAFETTVMENVEEAAERLGITAQQFQARLGDLKATGLGTFCLDQRGRQGERGSTCSTLDCWDNCPHLLIVAEIEAIAALQLWQGSLRAAQPQWERDRPERWETIWLPWLCLTDVVEEKMARGPLIKTWQAAHRRASELHQQAGYMPPQPW